MLEPAGSVEKIQEFCQLPVEDLSPTILPQERTDQLRGEIGKNSAGRVKCQLLAKLAVGVSHASVQCIL